MKRLTFLLMIGLMSACSNRTDIPKDILPVDTMRNILKDVLMAEGYSEHYISRDSLIHDKAKANQELLEDIFKVHHVTRADFKNSLSFYESRPDLNKRIFDSLAVYANAHKAELYAPKPSGKLDPGQAK